MKLMGEAKPTLLIFTSYFTINTSLFLLLQFLSLSQHRNHVQIFISVFYIAAAAILHRINQNSKNLLKDDDISSSFPFLDHDRDTTTGIENVVNRIDDHHEFECKKIGDEFYGDGCDHESELGRLLCGYEGDDEEEEDSDLSDKIEEFIAGRKREWREEMIRERFLFSA